MSRDQEQHAKLEASLQAIDAAIRKFGPSHPEVTKLLADHQSLSLASRTPSSSKGHSRPTLIGDSKNLSPKFCGRCGNPFLGKVQCECGWKPTQARSLSLSTLTIGLSVGLILFVAVCGVCVHFWYHWFPDSPAADRHLSLANDLFLHRQFEQAEEEFKTAITLSPNRGDVHYRYAWNLLNQGKPSGAVQEMRNAAELSPGDEKTQVQLAEMLLRDRQYDQATAQFAKCEKQFPQRAQVYLMREAACIRSAGKPENALPIYLKCASQNPKNELAWSQSVACLEALNRKQEAIATARKALKSLPNSAYMHFRLGYLLSDTPSKAEGILELRKSAELDPSTTSYIANLIDHLADNGAQKSYLVPLRRSGRDFTTEAVLNGKIRLVLVVDSGAETCIIPSRIATALGIDLSQCPPVTIRGVTGTSLASVVVLKSVKVGAAKFENVRAIAYDYHDPNADGLLGMSFLENFAFSIDAQRHSLSLVPKIRTELPPISQRKIPHK